MASPSNICGGAGQIIPGQRQANFTNLGPLHETISISEAHNPVILLLHLVITTGHEHKRTEESSSDAAPQAA